MYQRTPDVIETDLDRELILMDPVGGRMFSLNATGRRVWRALPATARTVAEALAAEMEVDAGTAERDVQALLDGLEDAGLVRRA
jgi:predicted transcriptional regulator